MEKKVRILCLDGGGIRGIIPATVMKYVEEQLAIRTNNQLARISDYFDMIVGTSTGAILGCFYLMPHPEKGNPGKPNSKFDAAEALKLYSDKGHLIFNESKKPSWFGIRQLINATRFTPDNLERLFMDYFGDEKFNNLLKPCIVTTYNLEKQNSFFFNSNEVGEKRQTRRFLVRDVARSTSAAPTYFPPALIKSFGNNEEMVNIDGGVFANNPTMCAYAEARTTQFKEVGIDYPKAADMLILSIGTGSQPLDLKNHKKSGNWGVVDWAKNIPDIMMDGGLSTVNYQVDKIFETINDKNRKNYKRINVPKHLRGLDENNKRPPLYNSDMADASPQNIRNLIIAGEEALEAAKMPNDKCLTIDQFIDYLIAIDEEIKKENDEVTN